MATVELSGSGKVTAKIRHRIKAEMEIEEIMGPAAPSIDAQLGRQLSDFSTVIEVGPLSVVNLLPCLSGESPCLADESAEACRPDKSGDYDIGGEG